MWLGADMNPWFVKSERKGAADPPAMASVGARADLAWLFMPCIIPFFGLDFRRHDFSVVLRPRANACAMSLPRGLTPK